MVGGLAPNARGVLDVIVGGFVATTGPEESLQAYIMMFRAYLRHFCSAKTTFSFKKDRPSMHLILVVFSLFCALSTKAKAATVASIDQTRNW